MKMPQNNMNPMQMMSQMFGNNGQLPQFDENMFRRMLPSVTEEQINQVVQMARSMGMSEQQIEEGMKFLRSFKK